MKVCLGILVAVIFSTSALGGVPKSFECNEMQVSLVVPDKVEPWYLSVSAKFDPEHLSYSVVPEVVFNPKTNSTDINIDRVKRAMNVAGIFLKSLSYDHSSESLKLILLPITGHEKPITCLQK